MHLDGLFNYRNLAVADEPRAQDFAESNHMPSWIRTRCGQHLAKLVVPLAKTYRITLGAFGTLCCIGVTGSCGKTMTKELIAAILSTHARGRKSTRSYNGPRFVI